MPTLHEEGVSPTPPLPLTSAWAVREGKDKVFGAVGGGGGGGGPAFNGVQSLGQEGSKTS